MLGGTRGAATGGVSDLPSERADWCALSHALPAPRRRDPDGFRRTTSNALRATSLIVIPVALGCYLYPDIGIAFFDRKLFQRAEENVRVLSLFVFLLYSRCHWEFRSSPPGGSGLDRSAVFVCAGKPDARSDSGSMVPAPSGKWRFGRFGDHGDQRNHGSCERDLSRAGRHLRSAVSAIPVPTLVSGAAMVLAGRALHGLSSFVAAPIAVAVYAGAVAHWRARRTVLAELRTMVASKLSRLLRR